MDDDARTPTTAEIIVQDATGALAWVGDEIVYLVRDRVCADCGHLITGREIDNTPKAME